MSIKRISVLFVIIAVLSMAVYVVAEEILTNETVVKMVNAKLGDTLIIGKIKSSKTNFDLSTDAIIKLKQAGVSDKVIEAMLGKNTSSSVGDSKMPLIPPSYGYYVIDERGGPQNSDSRIRCKIYD